MTITPGRGGQSHTDEEALMPMAGRAMRTSNRDRGMDYRKWLEWALVLEKYLARDISSAVQPGQIGGHGLLANMYAEDSWMD